MGMIHPPHQRVVQVRREQTPLPLLSSPLLSSPVLFPPQGHSPNSNKPTSSFCLSSHLSTNICMYLLPAGTMNFDTDLANYSLCEGMESAPNRFSMKDCRLACAYDPNCMVWQAFPIVRSVISEPALVTAASSGSALAGLK